MAILWAWIPISLLNLEKELMSPMAASLNFYLFGILRVTTSTIFQL